MTAAVDPSNAEQLNYWDGDQGAFWATWADRFDDGVAAYREHLLAAAAIEAGSTVLDVGCGSGQATRDAARRATAGSALGVDLSSRMLQLARVRAQRERLSNATFEQADAQVHPFPDKHFDLVISRHGAIFFGDPAAAFANLARAMRSGGRLVVLAWQPLARNEWSSSFRAALAAGRDLPAPPETAGSLKDPDQTRELLTGAGFTGVRVDNVCEPMYFGRDVEDAHRFVSAQLARMITDLDAGGKALALENLRATMADHLTDRGVYYDSASWLIRARLP